MYVFPLVKSYSITLNMFFMITCFKLYYSYIFIRYKQPAYNYFLDFFWWWFQGSFVGFFVNLPIPMKGPSDEKTCGRIDSEFGVQVMHYTWIYCLFGDVFFFLAWPITIFHHHLAEYFFSNFFHPHRTTKSKKGQYWISKPKTCWGPGRDL